MFSVIAFIVGALAWRIRGGAGNEIVRKRLKKPRDWEISNGIIRAVWAVAVASVFFAYTGSYGFLAAVLMAAGLGGAFGYWGKFDLALSENRNWANYSKLSVMAVLRFAPLAIVFFQTSYLTAFIYGMAAGLLFVPAYLLGVEIEKRWKYMGHSQYGEVLFGGCIMLAMTWGL